MVRVECRGMDAESAKTLGDALGRLLEGVQARDGALAPPEALVVVDDFAGALAEAGVAPGAAAAVHVVHQPGGVRMLVDGRGLAAVLAGTPEELARLVHLLHRELWRIQESVQRQARPAPGGGEYEQHLQAVVESLWAEYASTRRAVWSLPADADLLLPHLAELLEALPGATAADIALALAEGGALDPLFAKVLGRVTHLMQVMGHVQGYLAGLGRSVESLSPEVGARIAGSVLGPRWVRCERLLAALYGSAGEWDGEFLHNTLRPEVLAVFAALGLDLRPTPDGGVWLEPRPAVLH